MNSPPPWPPTPPNGTQHPPHPHPMHQDRRITVLEQTAIRLQQMAAWHIESINQRISSQQEEIKDLRQEHQQLYTQALRIVLAAASGAALIIFNVIWTSATNGSG